MIIEKTMECKAKCKAKFALAFLGFCALIISHLSILPFRQNGEANRGRVHEQLERQIA
jgi:hypothetical protein